MDIRGIIIFHFFLLLSILIYSQNPKVIAHRGASGYCPENTLAAVQKALDIGVDLIEIDIHLSKDGEVIVIHDETVDRTTDGSGLVADFTLDELKALDAGSWFSEKYEGEKIPELSEVLKLCVGKCPVLIEVKKGENYYPEIEKKSWQIIQQMEAEDWVEFQSFYDHSIHAMESEKITAPFYKLLVGVYPGFPLYFDHRLKTGNYFNKKTVNISGINPNENFVTQAFLKEIKLNNLQTYIWTVNDTVKMKKLIEQDVDGIITNYPMALKELLHE